MPIQELSQDQVRTWTREQKDRWWLENVYRGDLPQLTFRAAVTGFLIGGILSATALYIGGKTGIGIGVGLTSVIVAYAVYRALAQLGLSRDFTILENNATQSIATAAGYMITPLISSMAAYMLVTQRLVPWWQLMIWNCCISMAGVLMAFPLKRRFVNQDQLPFPEGAACGLVLDTLYHGKEGDGQFRARVLGVAAAIAGGLKLLSGEALMKVLQFKVLFLDKWAGWKEPWYFRERFDEYYYGLAARFNWYIPSILGTDIRQLGLRLSLDFALVGVGGLMGMKVAASVLLGTLVNYAVLAPIMIQRGDIAPRLNAAGILVPVSRTEIVNQWSLWWGVAIMVVGSLVSLAGRPEIFRGAFALLKGRKEKTTGEDVLRRIELPLWVSFVGLPILCLATIWLAHTFFQVSWWVALVSLPLIFVLTIISTYSMALTSWTPTSALSKITQFTIGAIDRSNPAANLVTGSMTAEMSSNAANLLSDIKPGYMLGAKPRQQAIGHVIGIFAGALAATPLFFLLFLPPQNVNGELVRTPETLISDQFPMPNALQWKGVSDLISAGLKHLPGSAVVSLVIAAALGAAFEIARIRTRGRFPLVPVAIGLGVVLPPDACVTMFLGPLVFWLMKMKYRTPGTRGHTIWVECLEPICAGLISGAALVGVTDAILGAMM